MTGQKEAIVKMVKHMLPSFNPHKDVALVMLTKDQLEQLKIHIGQCIMSGTVAYSKPLVQAEVMAYARSCVMNHLKKSRELNGNQIYGVGPAVAQPKQHKAMSALNRDLLSDDLRAFVDTLT